MKIVFYFTDDIFKPIFLNEKYCNLIQIQTKRVTCPIDNNPAWVHDGLASSGRQAIF